MVRFIWLKQDVDKEEIHVANRITLKCTSIKNIESNNILVYNSM